MTSIHEQDKKKGGRPPTGRVRIAAGGILMNVGIVVKGAHFNKKSFRNSINVSESVTGKMQKARRATASNSSAPKQFQKIVL